VRIIRFKFFEAMAEVWLTLSVKSLKLGLMGPHRLFLEAYYAAKESRVHAWYGSTKERAR
jgi:hypothetical protein